MKAKNLTKNPFLLLTYTAIALALVINIFVAGYWFGRTRQLKENICPSQARAQSNSLK
jgi:hypothetical protein